MGVMIITHQFVTFNYTKESQNTLVQSMIIVLQNKLSNAEGISLYMVTTGGQTPKLWSNFSQNMGVITLTHQFVLFNHTK